MVGKCGDWKFQIRDLHFKSCIRLINSVIPHRIVPAHSFNRPRILNTFYLPENMFDHAFKHIENILLLYEGHFTIYLSEFRLAIGTKILIAKTFYHLVIAIVTANHQKLFKRLW